MTGSGGICGRKVVRALCGETDDGRAGQQKGTRSNETCPHTPVLGSNATSTDDLSGHRRALRIRVRDEEVTAESDS
jgi:hypothetical protein